MNSHLDVSQSSSTGLQSKLDQIELLNRSERKFLALAKAIDKKVWTFEGDGKGVGFHQVFPWWGELTGRILDDPNAWIDSIHPDDQLDALKTWHVAVKAGLEYHSKYRLRDTTGTWRHLKICGVPILESDGRIGEWIGTCEDVTEQCEAVMERDRLFQEAETERARLEEVFRHAPSFIAVLRGPDHIFERVNDHYVNLIGGRSVVGKSVREALPEVEGQGYMELLNSVYQSATPHVASDAKVVLKNPTGTTECIVQFVYQPMFDSSGTVSGIMVQGIDLTNHYNTATELARVTLESERQRRMYETALSNTADFVYLFDLEGRFTFVNKALLDLWDKDLSEAVGRNFFELDYPVEMAAMLQQHIEEVIATGQCRKNETPYTSSLGTRNYEYIFVPVHGQNGMVEAVAGSTRDITDRKRMESALRESERRHRALVNSTSDVIYRMSPDWSTMYTLDGRDFIASTFSPTKNWMEKNIPETEHALVRNAIELAISQKSTFELEHQIIRVDGSIGWTHSKAIPIVNDDGNIQDWFGIASDVTRRKIAEEELKDIRSRMEAALNAGAIGTWSWEVVSDRLFADISFTKIFPVDPTIINGGRIEKILTLIHPDDRDRISFRIQEALRSEKHYEESYRVSQPDGSWKWVTARGQVERDENGRPLRFPGVVIDITDWKKAEEKLSEVTFESEQRRRLYETILSNTPDLIYVFSLDYRIQYANEALLKMWGYSFEQAIGKSLLELRYEPWHAEMHEREIDQVRKTKSSIRGEVPFVGTNGRRIYDYIMVPVIDAFGDVVAVAGTTRDVTERRQLEDTLRETDRRKDEFLAMLAHELRNPLVPIRTGLDILAMETSENQEIIGLMNDQMVHIIRLVDDLLDVSRIMQGKVELRKEHVDISDICRRSIETLRSVIESHHHQLTVSLPIEPLWLNADPVRLVQVVGNLLNNSTKYMQSGGHIELKVERQGEHAVVTVKDHGIGIELELLPRVFDLFTQSSRSLDRAQGGLGIGLTLVQRLVQMHDGTVTAHSEGVGHGSTFVIKLPTVLHHAIPTEPIFELSSHLNRRVVVVDDNRSASFLIGRLLEKLGKHEIEIAHDGESAIARVKEHKPEIVFLDIGLPGMDGYEVCRAIRANEGCEGILIVALTGYGQEEHRSKSKEVGFDEHLVKPPSIQQISKILLHPKLRSSQQG